MPELDLLTSKGGLHPFAFARLFSVMFFPTDGTRREEFRVWAHKQAPLEPLIPTAEPSALYRVLDYARDHYMRRGKRIEHGGMAGEILVTIRQIHEYHRQIRADEPSTSKSIVIVAARRTIGTSILETAWRNFRSVAHLWAALVCGNLQARGVEFPREFDPSYLDSLPVFLALAENMRRFGEGLTTRAREEGKPKPILPPEQTWKVPEGFPLPEVGLRLPRLSERDVGELRGYRARHRH